jgi:hypothetical protein
MTSWHRLVRGLLPAVVLYASRAGHAAEPELPETVAAYVARATELYQHAEALNAQGDRGAARHYHDAARAAAAALARVDRASPHYLVYAQTLAPRVVRAYKHALLLLDHPALWTTARAWCATPAVTALEPATDPRLAEVRAWCDALPPAPRPPQIASNAVYDPWTGTPSPPPPPPPPNPAPYRLASGTAANTTFRVADSTESPFLPIARNDRDDVFLPVARKQ